MKRPCEETKEDVNKKVARDASGQNYSIGATQCIELGELGELFNDGLKPLAQRRIRWKGEKVLTLLGTNSDKGDIDSVEGSRSLTVPLTKEDVTVLESLGRPSMVGKNEKTVFDKKVRRSLELTWEHIKVDEALMNELKNQVELMRKELKHPFGFELVFHKLIVYRARDFFKEHMDALHTEGMLATLSVELLVEAPSNKDDENNSQNEEVDDEESDDEESDDDILGENPGLYVEGEFVKRPNQSEQIALGMFWHGARHKVVKDDQNYRVCLIFDLIEKGEEIDDSMIERYRNCVNKAIDRLRGVGAMRSGIFLHQTHFGGSKVKGNDRILFEVLKKAIDEEKIEICDVWLSRLGLCKRETLKLVHLTECFEALYHKVSKGDDDEDEHHATIERIEERRQHCVKRNNEEEDQEDDEDDDQEEDFDRGKTGLFLLGHRKAFRPSIDPDGIMSRACQLGDVLFIDSATCNPNVLHDTDGDGSEIHLGNEGFFGCPIFTTPAMIFPVPQ